ncbi:hypothetical protein GTP27_11370 [Pseudoduganella sp. CY13W]|uniref:DUF3617 family protein n=2 Tax=Duganella qianjiadongensis TaxID=2692176 RepID=A0ABW9VKE5_9BURK|nr:hypothetical protein [Duganella qianjiadongensis]
MKLITLSFLAGAFIFEVAFAAPSKTWDGTYSAFSGYFLIYSNDLAEKAPPTATDRRASFAVQGSIAKTLFESIGPDQKDACGASVDLRIRERSDVSCTLYRPDKKNPYTCHFGLDLKTGKSIAGSIC